MDAEQVYALGGGWQALRFPDGRIVLQYISHVVISGTGQDLDLNRLFDLADEATRNEILEKAQGKMLVRTLELHPDGSMLVEPNAISLDGQIDDSRSYAILPSVLSSLTAVMQKQESREGWGLDKQS